MHEQANPMHHHYDGISISGVIATITLYILGKMSLAEWALVATIVAALSTAIYNFLKMWKDWRK